MNPEEIMQKYIDMLNQIQQSETEKQMNADGDNRTEQIKDLVDTKKKTVANAPGVQYADVDAVTTNAGGGVNGPKDPADMRGEHPSLYPSKQLGFRDYVAQIEQAQQQGEQ